MTTRRQLMNELRAMNVNFEEDATLVQLRSLYLANLPVQGVNNLGTVQPQPQPDGHKEPQQPGASKEQQQPGVDKELQQPGVSEKQQQANVHKTQQQPGVSQPQQPEKPCAQQSVQLQPTAPQNPHLHPGTLQLPQQSSAMQQQQSQLECNLQQLPLVNKLEEEEAKLDQLITIARKKKELLALQAGLVTVENRGIDLGTLDAMVRKFDGSDSHDVHKWLQDAEYAFEIFQYSSRDRLVAARHLLVGHAKRLLEMISVT